MRRWHQKRYKAAQKWFDAEGVPFPKEWLDKVDLEEEKKWEATPQKEETKDGEDADGETMGVVETGAQENPTNPLEWTPFCSVCCMIEKEQRG